MCPLSGMGRRKSEYGFQGVVATGDTLDRSFNGIRSFPSDDPNHPRVMKLSSVTASTSVAARIADRLAQSVGSHRYNMWFNRSARFDYDRNRHRLEVKVPNRFVADWIGRHFKRQLHEAAEQELGDSVDLNVHVDAGIFADITPGLPADEDQGASVQVAASQRPKSRQRLRHQLEDFIVGPSNELAYAAANTFAQEHPGPANTLFIHGGCGLGKTHLLQSICRRVLSRRGGGRIRYTTSEQFTNEFLAAMRAKRLDSFRQSVRQLDLLALDDVHFLAGKQATQQEFLYSFDAIDLSGARVVMASDSHPKLIEKLSEALVSRCMRGMVVKISDPDTALRINIVRVLAQRRGILILDSVIEVLAARCQGSVREIEGTISKLHALVHLGGEKRGDESGQDAVGHAILNRLFEAERTDQPRRAVSFESILKTVTEQMRIPRNRVMGHSRHRAVVAARSMVIYLTRQLTAMSYPEIAVAMGRSNHSTVLTATRRVEQGLARGASVYVTGELMPVSLNDLAERLKHEIVHN